MIRSMLFIPGNTPNLLIHAGQLGADAVVFDLEDSVSPAEKDSARILVRNTLQNMDFEHCKTIVRINPLDTDYWKADLQQIVPAKPDHIILPKTNGSGDLYKLAQRICKVSDDESYRPKVIALIETAMGVECAFEIAATKKVVGGLFLGAEDLSSDLHCKRTKGGQEILYARQRLVMAARANGIEVYDTPFTDINDDEGIYEDAKLAKSLGFSGKVSISPRHVEAINQVFSPSEDEIAQAKEVMAAIEEAEAQGRGTIALHGKMIDAPVVHRAEQVLQAAKEIESKGV